MLDDKKIVAALKGFIKSHKTSFAQLPKNQSALLEVGALVAVAEHYRQAGYQLSAQNLQAKRFRVKTGSRGYPFNFSWFEGVRGNQKVSIHGNLSVFGAHRDGGIFVVDVAVVQSGSVPLANLPGKKWTALRNNKVITFAEVKKLVIFPMLLAQFVGIVNEIKPRFLLGKRPVGFLDQSHFYPALLTTGYLTANSRRIARGFRRRKYLITIAPAFDGEIAAIRSSSKLFSPVIEDPLLAAKKWRH